MIRSAGPRVSIRLTMTVLLVAIAVRRIADREWTAAVLRPPWTRGSGSTIRTYVDGFRVRRPAARRSRNDRYLVHPLTRLHSSYKAKKAARGSTRAAYCPSVAKTALERLLVRR